MRLLRAAEGLHTFAFSVFAWAAVVAPAVHLANHRNDHVHTAGGVRRLPEPTADAQPGPHDHGDGRQHSHAQPTGDPTHAPPSSPAPDHGQGAGDHFGLVLLEAVAFVAPVPRPLVTLLRAPTRPLAPSLKAPDTHQARGPPTFPDPSSRLRA